MELNIIHNADCLQFMSNLDDNCIDLSLTSPPYNTGGQSFTVGDFYKDYKDNLSENEYQNFIYGVVNELLRITKHYVVFNFQILSGNKRTYLQFFSDYKNNIKDIAIWNKQAVAQINKGKMATGYEFVVIMGKDDKMIFEYNNFPDNNYVPNIKTWYKKESIKGHGATMPIEMAQYFIEYFSKKGDIVFDPFMGTGTTAIASIKQGRNYLGTEITKEYIEIAKQRLKPYEMQTSLF